MAGVGLPRRPASASANATSALFRVALAGVPSVSEMCAISSAQNAALAIAGKLGGQWADTMVGARCQLERASQLVYHGTMVPYDGTILELPLARRLPRLHSGLRPGPKQLSNYTR